MLPFVLSLSLPWLLLSIVCVFLNATAFYERHQHR